MYHDKLNGVDFEHLLLQQYGRVYKKNEKWTTILNYKSPTTLTNSQIPPLYQERKAKYCGHGFWWCEPPKNVVTEFCLDSSLHGLRFVAKNKQHLCERIFWAVTFIASVVIAVLLINDVWFRFNQNPVIVSFNPRERDIDELPFPAVTICNMNPFPKSFYEEKFRIIQNAKMGLETNKEDLMHAIDEIKMIIEACSGQVSFAKSFGFAHKRGEIDQKLITGTGYGHDDIINFLIDNTLPCDQLIRYCLWSEDVQDCNTFFKSVVTNYGKCCTFNMLPESQLLKRKLRIKDSKSSSNSNKTYVPRWSKAENENWSKWDYIHDGFLLKQNIVQPRRQRRAGLTNGLSILLDPNTKDNFCPLSDSEGIRLMLHTPLEYPKVQDFGTIIGLGHEVFMEVLPEVTFAHADIESYDRGERKCVFGDEIPLTFYKPYTATNCKDECEIKLLQKQCNCTEYYMPKSNNSATCSLDANSEQRKCIRNSKDTIVADFKKQCGHCLSLCQSMGYTFEVTISKLHAASTLWGDHQNKSFKPEWMNNKMSILHIYFGSDSVVPKLRTTLYGATDLIANTGGLLGLTLGFSVLSLVEILYFVTLRAFWICRRRTKKAINIGNQFLTFVWKSRNIPSSSRVNADKNPLVYPSPLLKNSEYSQGSTNNYNCNFLR